jgi:zinc-ribbon domain
VEQISGSTPAEDTAAPNTGRAAEEGEHPQQPGFAGRGRMRRRARFLRRARELAYRDLGGLVFNLHRFGQRNDPLVMGKLETLGRIDAQLRALEAALSERVPVTVLQEAGVSACPRCAAIHASEDRFCPNCGLALGKHPDLPIASGAAAPAPAGTAGPAPQSMPGLAAAAPGAAGPPSAPGPATAPAGEAAARAGGAAPSTPPPHPTAAPVAARSREGEGKQTQPPEVRTGRAPEPPSISGDEPTEILHPPAPGK